MATDLDKYPSHLFEFIPLHRPKATKTMPNGKVVQVGKAPLHAKWTTKQYDNAAVLRQAKEEKRNVGVRLKADQLVIDVDPRNGGEAGFASLCADIGFDPDAFPRVITGSGGLHIYMAKPADVLIRDTLESDDYNGVEFKSKGRQVVAAGSVHPNGKPYRWSTDHPDIRKVGLPDVPDALLRVIRRPPRSAVTGGGQYTPAQVADVLSRLDVTKFSDNDSWLQLMMAIHHASAGEARGEFLEWSAQDPEHAASIYMAGKRWDSLHAERNDGVTYRTLNMILRKHNAASAQVAYVADDEFDDLPDDDNKPTKREKKTKGAAAEFDAMGEDDDDDWLNTGEIPNDGVRAEGYDEEAIGELNRLNEEYVALLEAGKFKIMYQAEDPEVDNRRYWVTCDRMSFESMYCNRRLEREMDGMSRNAASTVPLGKAWVEWRDRKTVKGVVFEPDSSKGDRDGYLNLWTGFGFQPDKKGSWNWLNELMFEQLATKDQRIYDYMVNWIAQMFQKPTIIPQVALVFRGDQGIGKGTLGNALVKTVGVHALAIGSADQLTGRFNAHMRNLIFLFADEATMAYGNKQTEGKLKHLISEPLIQIEKKGVDTVRVRNLLHVMAASNNKWVVPAGPDERRYMVQEAGNGWRGTDKFKKLHRELEANGNSGYKRLLWDMLTHKIPDSYQAGDFPITKALVDQKILSMTPVKRYFYNLLQERSIPFTVQSGNWRTTPIRFFLHDFRSAFHIYCAQIGVNAGSNGRSSHSQLMAEIAELFPSAKPNERYDLPKTEGDDDGTIPSLDGKALGMELPVIDTCFREFEKACGLPYMALGECEVSFG